MARKKHNRYTTHQNNRQQKQPAGDAPRFSQQRTQNAVIIGMFTVKTITDRDGQIIVKQGSRITHTVMEKAQAQQVVPELTANAMPGNSS